MTDHDRSQRTARVACDTVAECAAEVARYQAVGVEELIMRCQWPDMPRTDALQAIERCGHEVLPCFAP